MRVLMFIQQLLGNGSLRVQCAAALECLPGLQFGDASDVYPAGLHRYCGLRPPNAHRDFLAQHTGISRIEHRQRLAPFDTCSALDQDFLDHRSLNEGVDLDLFPCRQRTDDRNPFRHLALPGNDDRDRCLLPRLRSRDGGKGEQYQANVARMYSERLRDPNHKNVLTFDPKALRMTPVGL